MLVEAFERFHRRHPDSGLLIVGSGPEQAAMEFELAARGLLGCTRFAGAVDPSEVPGWLSAMDCAVAPYPAHAGFYFSPLKVYEYMAAARPVVASSVGELTSLLQHGVNGLLCPPGDAAAFALAFERLHDDPALASRLGQAARDAVLAEHTWDAVASRVLRLADASSRMEVGA